MVTFPQLDFYTQLAAARDLVAFRADGFAQRFFSEQF